MAPLWTRTRRHMTLLWLGTAVLEAGVLVLVHRTNNSWLLLLALAVLVIPLAAAEMTSRWFSRAPRKRWKRHDLEDALAAEARAAKAAGPAPRRPGA